MFDHMGYEVTDLKRSTTFFEKVLATLGHTKLADYPDYGVVGFGTKRPQFWISQGKPHNQADEVHICFSAPSRKHVDAFYAAAMAAGAKDNGKPGLRPEYHEHYYGAFVFDFDGFNIEAACH